MTLRILVVDDEAPARERLKQIIAGIPGYEVVGEAQNGNQVAELVATLKPQVVLLDIRMPGLSGLDLADLFAKQRQHLGVIFVTAYDQHAVDAFDLDVDDYITKPIRPSRLERALGRVRERLQVDSEPVRTLAIPVLDQWVFLELKDVMYAVVQSGSLDIHTGDRVYYVPWTLSQLEEKMGHRHAFVKANRQTLVNLSYAHSLAINESGTGLLKLQNGDRIATSRTATRLIKSRF
ncbi:MAG: response regulator transcription factor [Acidobacteria bacterium]|nr:response regulator transcription factor [Acidobacteriota bacterium]